jgi:hypothetical protein
VGAGKAGVPEDTEQGSKPGKMNVYLGIREDSWPPDGPDEYCAPPGYPVGAVL